MSCLSSFVKKKPTVSVIVLEGQIGRQKALSLKKTKEMIAKAFKKPNLVAVAMVINSGGGSPVQSQLIASYLLDWSPLFIPHPQPHFHPHPHPSGSHHYKRSQYPQYLLRSILVTKLGNG